MIEWSVSLGFAHRVPANELTDRVDDLLEALAPQHAAASYDGHGITVQLTVTATSFLKAEEEALTVLLLALRKAGIGNDGIFGAQAQTMEQLAREQEASNMPELIGVTELAQLLGVTRQRASELARTGSGFPRPLTFLASGPVWDKSTILRYVDQWERRPRGRPKRVSATV
jgi:hypothetical protein